jgi:putative ABC transport system permease protein
VIGHLFRLTWNRRGANALVLVELFVSFLVLCAVLTGATWTAVNATRPLGFEWKDAWRIRFVGGVVDMEAQDSLYVAMLRRILDEAVQLPEVESAALASNTPYSGDTHSTTSWVGGRQTNILSSPMTVGGLAALRLELKSGRWFEEGDAGLAWRPVVLTEGLARGWFGTDDPIGKELPEFNDDGTPSTPEDGARRSRVVGVVADYRRDGELDATPYAYFIPANLERMTFATPTNLLLRLRPGTPASAEEGIVRRLQGSTPGFSLVVEPLSRMRDFRIRSRIVPLAIGGVVAFFLIAMVGLGLVGVLWQNVARRTPEFGVRRALGATGRGVLLQILGEVLALTTLAIAAGTALVLQVPLLGLLPAFSPLVVTAGILEASLVLYLFVSFCGLYPGWLATRIDPARALQYE